MDDSHALIRTLDLELKGKMKKGRSQRIWKKWVEEESLKVDLSKKDTLCQIATRLR